MNIFQNKWMRLVCAPYRTNRWPLPPGSRWLWICRSPRRWFPASCTWPPRGERPGRWPSDATQDSGSAKCASSSFCSPNLMYKVKNMHKIIKYYHILINKFSTHTLVYVIFLYTEEWGGSAIQLLKFLIISIITFP